MYKQLCYLIVTAPGVSAPSRATGRRRRHGGARKRQSADRQKATLLIKDGRIQAARPRHQRTGRLRDHRRERQVDHAGADRHQSPPDPDDRARVLRQVRGTLTDIAIQSAQMSLKFGMTTVADTWGPLEPLLEARDRINDGEFVASRVLVAGNIIGTGGPFSAYFMGGWPLHGDTIRYGSWVHPSIQQRIDALWEDDVGPRMLSMTARGGCRHAARLHRKGRGHGQDRRQRSQPRCARTTDVLRGGIARDGRRGARGRPADPDAYVHGRKPARSPSTLNPTCCCTPTS